MSPSISCLGPDLVTLFILRSFAVRALLASLPLAALPAMAQDLVPFRSAIPGVLDPLTGYFIPRAVEPMSAPASQTRAGQFNVVATIALQPSIDRTAPITCYFQLQHSGFAYSQEVGRVRGVRNGNTGTCQIAIPYNWVQVNPTVQVRLLYSISAGTYDIRHREASGNRGLPLPAPGAVTPISLAIRL